jgi:putative ABC transport system substrate-binding protein
MPLGPTNRRAFIAALGSAAAWPVVVRAQQSGKLPRVGVLWSASNDYAEAVFLSPLRKSFSDLGYVEGKTIELMNRFANNDYTRFDALAKELVEAKADVLVADIAFGALAAKRASTTTPVVFVVVPDPVGLHLVDSLAHPGGNMTGFSIMGTDLTAKYLELLKDCLAKLSNVVLLYNPNGSVAQRYADDALAAARRIRIGMSLIDVRAPNELESAFLVMAERHPDAVMIAGDAVLFNERKRIADLAIAHRLPTIGSIREMAESGVLITYGPDLPDLFRRAAFYVAKILKGANPADLPVEQPTKFDLVINLNTAKAVGVNIAGPLLARADEVIE